MKHRSCAILVCIAMILSLATGALAVDPAKMTDISGHWAENAIRYCLTNGLYNGVSDTSFDPEGGMTRGMFVTVLGRMAGVNAAAWQDSYLDNLYYDVGKDTYFAPYVNWATRYGVVNGMGGGYFAPDQPITREQMATMVVRYTKAFNCDIQSTGEGIADYFVDAGAISAFAKDSVEALRKTGILNGYPAGNGGYRFAPQETTTRAQCATVFYRLDRSIRSKGSSGVTAATGLDLSASSASLNLGESTTLTATVKPAGASNKTVTWVSSDPKVAKVDGGTVTALATGTATITAYTYNGYSKTCAVTVKSSASLASASESYADKCQRIFGKYVGRNTYQSYYASSGSSHVVPVTVRTWAFADSSRTTKTTKYWTLYVHKNIADTVKVIFEEIYYGDEKFPIYSMGAFRRGEVSEHGLGVAIDINPNENYQCANDGTAWTGSYWRPGTDPYSIPANGDVVRTFRKYGFGWGGTDWSSSHDYMHFSYFGW